MLVSDICKSPMEVRKSLNTFLSSYVFANLVSHNSDPIGIDSGFVTVSTILVMSCSDKLLILSDKLELSFDFQVLESANGLHNIKPNVLLLYNS